MPSASKTPRGADDELRWRICAVGFGALLGLSLLKFGNPVVMDRFLQPPAGLLELSLSSGWPTSWATWPLLLIAAVGLTVFCRPSAIPKWLLVLPLVWFGWQSLSATQTIRADVTAAVLRQFLGCLLCFYLGVFVLGRKSQVGWFWAGISTAFGLVLAVGINQHFGGLEETRRYFFLYIYPGMNGQVPPDLLKKISSDRIFGTLFYPNTLAGVILLLLPPVLALIWRAEGFFTRGARLFIAVAVTAGAMACLFWSGSKGGWLLLLLLSVIGLLHLRFSFRRKLLLVATVTVMGLAGFGWKYSAFLERGATSVVARFDYWRAAIQTAEAHPWLGTGPGTFSVTYAEIKRPESEMARLAHNDFIQQACDSGVPGFLTYAGFIVGLVVVLYRQANVTGDLVRFCTWLGFLGWSLQSLIEFNLYIPALAWTALAMGGWLLGSGARFRFDKASLVT